MISSGPWSTGSMNHHDVIIIGGGASGLMCAATAGKRGRRVLVLEHTVKVGKKILMSGGGRCNFTNLYVGADNYICANPHFCKSALKQYTQWDFIALVNAYRIPYHEREHGQLFCDESARQILDMLLAECESAGVEIRTGCEATSISHDGGFSLMTSRGAFTSDSLVIATGGLSIPTMGSSDFGLEVARQFGLGTLQTRAGLVPFVFSDRMKEITGRLSGIALEVELYTGQASFVENVLFTHRGLSGPAVLQLSNYWRPGEEVVMNLLPGVGVAELLHGWKSEHPKSRLRTLLAERLPKKLVRELEVLFWAEYAEKPLAEIPDRVLDEVAERLGGWRLRPAATEGYRTAEVTLGGVDTDELSSKTLESKKMPGLFFIGEVVDVTGHLGGFNFQWAWSSGYVAGLHA
jgi:predicted Rossmann fold flavoprotein